MQIWTQKIFFILWKPKLSIIICWFEKWWRTERLHNFTKMKKRNKKKQNFQSVTPAKWNRSYLNHKKHLFRVVISIKVVLKFHSSWQKQTNAAQRPTSRAGRGNQTLQGRAWLSDKTSVFKTVPLAPATLCCSVIFYVFKNGKNC